MSYQTNITRIAAIANALAELNKDVVYIGGAVVSLYCPRPELIDLRVTDDVDVIIEITSRYKFLLLEEKLRKLGFVNDMESGIICRWKYKGFIVDIIPTDQRILGFTNEWYSEGIQNKEKIEVRNKEIFILPVAYFLATKIEALRNRNGGTDWRWSQDFEDIIKIIGEIDLNIVLTNCNTKLKQYLTKAFLDFCNKEAYFREACSAHLITPFYTNNDIDNIFEKIKNSIDI